MIVGKLKKIFISLITFFICSLFPSENQRYLGAPLEEYEVVWDRDENSTAFQWNRNISGSRMRYKEMQFRQHEFERVPLLARGTNHSEEYLDLAMKRLQSMDFILIVDNLETTFKKFFGASSPSENSYSKDVESRHPRGKNSFGKGGGKMVHSYTPGFGFNEDDRRRIAELNDLDMELYNFGVALSEKQMPYRSDFFLTDFRWDFTESDGLAQIRYNAKIRGSKKCFIKQNNFTSARNHSLKDLV